MHWFHKGHKGVRWPFEQRSVRSMQVEMKTVTFTLVCAPGQEGPLRKVTRSAFSLCLRTLLSSGGRNGPLFITETARWHTHSGRGARTYSKSPFFYAPESTPYEMEFKKSCSFVFFALNFTCNVEGSNEGVWQLLSCPVLPCTSYNLGSSLVMLVLLLLSLCYYYYAIIAVLGLTEPVPALEPTGVLSCLRTHLSWRWLWKRGRMEQCGQSVSQLNIQGEGRAKKISWLKLLAPQCTRSTTSKTRSRPSCVFDDGTALWLRHIGDSWLIWKLS